MDIYFQHSLLQTRAEVHEATLTTLGKELQDNVGQLLTSAKWLVGIGKSDKENVQELLVMLDETLGKAVNELRSLSKVLSKDWMAQFNFVENLQTEVKRMNEATPVSIELSCPAEIKLKPEAQIILFRIVQKALQNAIKHASPGKVSITLSQPDEVLQIMVSDDGFGFDETLQHSGQGLMNMKKRTALLGGSIAWKAAPGKGTKVEIKIPVK